MNFRQVHLDFHTSEKVPYVGTAFNKAQFQDCLKRGHVNSITVFSKCHHGWAYHPSTANEPHPALPRDAEGKPFDLLGAEIEAAHEIGVKTPVYLSAGLDEKFAHQHPEWLLRGNRDQMLRRDADFTRPGYHQLCLNTPYLDILIKQVEEVVQNYDADGIFLDIVGVRRCYCPTCIQTLLNEGKDPLNDKDIAELGERIYANYTRRVREAIDKYKPGLPVFHNGGHIRRGRRDLAHMDTHLELESLPTGGWGYDHFPMSAAYVRTLDMQFLGMTGKFHTTWGEFGGFKHPNALRYESALSAAFGAKCSVGDQMHPLGALDPATYDLIGAGYAELEAKEPWLDGVTSVADIAVLSQEAVSNYYGDDKGRNASGGDVGAVRVLLEGNYLFDVVDTDAPLDKYKLVILPDTIRLDETLSAKLSAFVAAGGKILASGLAGLKADEDKFVFDLGATYGKTCDYQPVYFRPQFETPWQPTGFVIYQPAQEITATEGANVLALRENPYFNRTGEHFCSHQHTPNNPDEQFPAITVGKDGAYIATAIFEEYSAKGSLIAKKLALAAIEALIGETKTVTTTLPAQGIVTLMHQQAENRDILHLLFATPVKRGQGIEVIEDLYPLYDIDVTVNVPNKPNRVYSAPDSTDLAYTYENGKLSVHVDKFICHKMIVIE